MALHSEQERIHAIIGGFLRLDRSDDALWVSDYPRRNADTSRMVEQLNAFGVCCRLDEKTRLWHLDWTMEKWEQIITSLPESIPPFPADEKLHAAYAFCRFALLHPGKRTDESMRMLRAVMKGSAAFARLHEQAAQALRNGRPIAYEAGRLLALQLMKEEV